ncbi:sulfurtransferase complex subunit TusC [Gilvimarinus sp. DA14]|uniref:sulfurtransferase complex subunit TusC n=1 Tax=Gilvimarinus sp. DA14 TaxID=2956798 RepID=UPI0020B64C8B|nr:sulfurtransferase complex subunit TusC [Gilvimarinus sp. DA14]UTF60541.1 sulfurtransferase complex subunit TusC [Gilvimarinus sp. DA14]
MSKILCVSRHAPYGRSLAREALDAVLAAAAFEQEINLLLMDEGVWQLCQVQTPELIEQRDLSKNLSALPVFGVEEIYVHEPSLILRGLNRDSLSLNNVQLLSNEQTQALIASQDQLLSF